MSRRIKIKGEMKIENIQIAEEAIKILGFTDVKIEDNKFIFNVDYYDGIEKNSKIISIEDKYKELLAEYYSKIEEERRIIEEKKRRSEIKRLEEIRIIQEEKKRIEEEKNRLREEKKKKIIENAKKQGFRVKKEIQKDNKIKLVLEKRVY